MMGCAGVINERHSSDRYSSVVRGALEPQDAEESRASSVHIEEGYLQPKHGEFIDGA
jgi:hypothetical protein